MDDAALALDPYGHCGSKPIYPFLTSLLSRVDGDIYKLDEYIAGVVDWGPLSVGQMVALLQHLPPPPKGWCMDSPSVEDFTCLAEYETVIDRFLADVKRGAFPKAATLNELAAWCDQVGASLPDTVVMALQNQTTLNAENIRPKQSTTEIEYPAWVPLAKARPQVEVSQPRKRGRPQKMPDRMPGLTKEAEKILLAAASNGKHLTLKELAKLLQTKPIAADMTVENIHRRLKGQELPIRKARQTATANAPHIKGRAHPFKR